MNHVYILGTGAMGSLWGSYFYSEHSEQAYKLTFIGKSTTQQEYHYHLAPADHWIKALYTHAEAIEEPIEKLIIACKAFDAVSAIKDLKACLSEHCSIVLLQNGMGSQQEIAQMFPQHAIYACSSTEGAYKKDGHHLIHAGRGDNLIGPMNTTAVERGIPEWIPQDHYQYKQDIDTVLWRKLIINCAINPLTALYECANGDLLHVDEYHNHLRQLCRELQALIEYKGLEIEPAYDLARHVCTITAQNQSSMLQDKLKNKRTELAFISGYAIKELQQAKLEYQVHQNLYDTLKKQGVRD